MTTPAASPAPAAFSGLVDLASALVGGAVLAANDEFFAEKENLLKPEPAVFLPDRYTDRGKWMDGWETRRRRSPGHDWCIIRLGVPGVVRAVDVDTSHFLGNHPAEAAVWASRPVDADGEDASSWSWRPLAPRSALRPGSQNFLAVEDHGVVDHIRLEIFPDGGVARLRLWGEPRPSLPRDDSFDLAALLHGGRAVACSDMFFGRMESLILPGSPGNMGGGWETRRRRGPGHDWVVIHLATPGIVERLEIDTMHYKGNYPDRCSVEVCRTGQRRGPLDCHDAPWRQLLPESRLGPDQVHVFEDLVDTEPCDHLRLNIFPDGGVARLRVIGRPAR